MVNSRQKGKRTELELAHKLTELTGIECRRSQQYAGINGDADVIGLPFLHIESKAVERLRLREAMSQSENDAKEDEIPVVMHKQNRKPWLVTLNLEDFITLYKAWLKEWQE